MKTYAILPLESEAVKFSGMTFPAENLDNVVIVHVPDDTPVAEQIEFRDALVVAIPDKTVILVPASVKFCRIREVGAE